MMWRSVFLFIIVVNSLCLVRSFNEEMCGNNVGKTSSCTTQILGQDLTDSNTCKLEYIPSNSSQCINMKFGPLMNNNHIGGVSLSPYVMTHAARNNKNIIVNYTVLNITFNNIKWNTMKFQFKNMKKLRVNHCRNIIISNNVTINDQSILYYDCFWQHTINNNRETPSYILQFEATDDNVVNTGRYYFNVPTANMLSETVNASQWKPFIYIEMLPNMMRLHIMPPLSHLKIDAYKVEVIKQCDDPVTPEVVLVTKVLKLAKNDSKEQTFDYNWLSSYGLHYFVVRPLHDGCKENEASCQFVKSPTLDINQPVQTLSVCIVTIAAVVLAVLFVCFLVLKKLRHSCKEYFPDKGYYDKTLPSPPKILVIYSGVNRLHAKTVRLLVKFLRHDCGFDVKYAGDLQSLVNVDPLEWANRAYEESTKIIVVAGPSGEARAPDSGEGQVNEYENVNLCLRYILGRIYKSKTPKEIANVLFDYSDPATIPPEAKHCKRFHLLKDRHKMIAHLSRNKAPRMEIDKSFVEHLSVAKKLLVDAKEGHEYEV